MKDIYVFHLACAMYKILVKMYRMVSL